MFELDVLTSFAISGMGALLGLGLISSIRTDLPRAKQALVLHRWAFVFLLGLGVSSQFPQGLRSMALKYGIISDLIGLAMVGWAMRQLNGRRTNSMLAIVVLVLLGVALCACSFASPRLFVLAYCMGFFLVCLAITLDQGWLILASPRVSASEVLLLTAVIGFTLNWLLTIVYVVDYDQPIPAHWMVSPRWLQPWSALSYALLPLALAAVILTTINERLVHQLRTRALTDDLTGALSRRGLREMGERMLAIKASRPKLVAVLMIDVDFFKKVNDTYGHQAGDEVLRHITAVLRERLRTDALLARYGGEEFTVLLPVGEMHEAHVVAERLRIALETAPCPTKVGPIKITVSIGVAFHQEGTSLEHALGRADKCLYAAKEGGRNRVVVDTTL